MGITVFNIMSLEPQSILSITIFFKGGNDFY